MHPVGATPSARHLGHQFAAVLEKVKCRQRRSMVSWTPHKALQRGHSKCCPGTCSSRNSKRFGSPSKRHSATRHCCPSPSAAVKSSSGVILPTPVQCHPKRKLLLAFRTKSQKPLRSTARSEERAKGSRTQNTVTFLSAGAKPDQGRNEINGRGPPPAGRMPFMSDLTLIRLRSRATEPSTRLTKFRDPDSMELA